MCAGPLRIKRDTDIVFFHDPIRYFHENLQNFDVIFQDDGARTNRQSPYCANSQFYFIWNSPVTLYLFTSVLYHGDLVLGWGSHQEVLVALVNEYTSQFALKAKVINNRTTTDFS